MPLVSVDLEVIPTIYSEDVMSLISDESGVTRYLLVTKIWKIYSNVQEPFWFFPEGIHVERFDSLLNVEGYIVADTAYHFVKKELWQAIGNVVVTNIAGTTFETSELFWDVKAPPDSKNAFYTHQLVKIVEPDSTIIIGRNGFTADQSLNSRWLFSGKGELIVDESTDSLQQNTIRPDSIQLP